MKRADTVDTTRNLPISYAWMVVHLIPVHVTYVLIFELSSFRFDHILASAARWRTVPAPPAQEGTNKPSGKYSSRSISLRQRCPSISNTGISCSEHTRLSCLYVRKTTLSSESYLIGHPIVGKRQEMKQKWAGRGMRHCWVR